MSEKPPTPEQIVSWIRSLCAVTRIKTIALGDGSLGLVSVPIKYVALIDAMQQGLNALAAGRPLPRLVLAATHGASDE